MAKNMKAIFFAQFLVFAQFLSLVESFDFFARVLTPDDPGE